MAEFFQMGGHAIFVWGSYTVTAAILIALTVQSIAAMRQAEAKVGALRQARGRRRERARATAAGPAAGPGEPEGA